MSTDRQSRPKHVKRTPLTIGRLAREAGVNVETVRYYQRVGLIDEPPKPFSGFRTYPIATIDRIKFVKRAQGLGFTLAEISELLDLGEGRCDDVRRRAESRRAQIRAQIRALRALDKTLNKLIGACRSKRRPTCPIVETLSNTQRH